jgi:hypothetical protein
MTKSHNASQLIDFAFKIKHNCENEKRLANLNPISRAKELHPVAFYSSIVGALGIAALVAIKVIGTSQNK